MKFVCPLYRVPADEYLALARAAEAAGYEALALSDHLVHLDAVESRFPYTPDGALPWQAEDDYPDVWVATAMMAAVTRRLRFLQAVYVLPAREPFGVAKALGTLARMSGHRLSLGFGVGWMREEFELVGQPFAGRGGRAEEMIELMRRLWTGEPVDYEGEHYRVRGGRMRPAAGGPIPILCSGESDIALHRAARLGDGWIAPISVATPEQLALRVEQLARLRQEAGREKAAFSVYWTPMQEIDAEDLQELSRYGASHLFATPWSFDEGPTLPLEEKRARLAEFGRRLITPSSTPAT
jgi:probable F420-dependent oxidoreductase